MVSSGAVEMGVAVDEDLEVVCCWAVVAGDGVVVRGGAGVVGGRSGAVVVCWAGVVGGGMVVEGLVTCNKKTTKKQKKKTTQSSSIYLLLVQLLSFIKKTRSLQISIHSSSKSQCTYEYDKSASILTKQKCTIIELGLC